MAEAFHRSVSCDCGCKNVIDITSSKWIRVETVYYGATTASLSPHYLDFVDWSHLAVLANFYASSPPPDPGP